MPEFSQGQIEAILDDYRRGESAAQIARRYAGQEQPDSRELEWQRKSEALHSASTAPGQEPTPDPISGMLDTYRSATWSGSTPTAAMAQGLDTLFEAAVSGDERVAANRYDQNVRDRWTGDARRRMASAAERQTRTRS